MAEQYEKPVVIEEPTPFVGLIIPVGLVAVAVAFILVYNVAAAATMTAAANVIGVANAVGVVNVAVNDLE